MSFLGLSLLVVIHDSTVSYASSIIRSGANLYCNITQIQDQAYSDSNFHISKWKCKQISYWDSKKLCLILIIPEDLMKQKVFEGLPMPSLLLLAIIPQPIEKLHNWEYQLKKSTKMPMIKHISLKKRHLVPFLLVHIKAQKHLNIMVNYNFVLLL